jgi:hypothetical protein
MINGQERNWPTAKTTNINDDVCGGWAAVQDINKDVEDIRQGPKQGYITWTIKRCDNEQGRTALIKDKDTNKNDDVHVESSMWG